MSVDRSKEVIQDPPTPSRSFRPPVLLTAAEEEIELDKFVTDEHEYRAAKEIVQLEDERNNYQQVAQVTSTAEKNAKERLAEASRVEPDKDHRKLEAEVARTEMAAKFAYRNLECAISNLEAAKDKLIYNRLALGEDLDSQRAPQATQGVLSSSARARNPSVHNPSVCLDALSFTGLYNEGLMNIPHQNGNADESSMQLQTGCNQTETGRRPGRNERFAKEIARDPDQDQEQARRQQEGQDQSQVAATREIAHVAKSVLIEFPGFANWQYGRPGTYDLRTSLLTPKFKINKRVPNMVWWLLGQHTLAEAFLEALDARIDHVKAKGGDNGAHLEAKRLLFFLIQTANNTLKDQVKQINREQAKLKKAEDAAILQDFAAAAATADVAAAAAAADVEDAAPAEDAEDAANAANAEDAEDEDEPIVNKGNAEAYTAACEIMEDYIVEKLSNDAFLACKCGRFKKPKNIFIGQIMQTFLGADPKGPSYLADMTLIAQAIAALIKKKNRVQISRYYRAFFNSQLSHRGMAKVLPQVWLEEGEACQVQGMFSAHTHVPGAAPVGAIHVTKTGAADVCCLVFLGLMFNIGDYDNKVWLEICKKHLSSTDFLHLRKMSAACSMLLVPTCEGNKDEKLPSNTCYQHAKQVNANKGPAAAQRKNRGTPWIPCDPRRPKRLKTSICSPRDDRVVRINPLQKPGELEEVGPNFETETNAILKTFLDEIKVPGRN